MIWTNYKVNILKRIIRFIMFFRFVNLIYNFTNLKFSKVNFQKTLRINGRLKLVNKGQLTIRENVIINSGRNYNIIGGDIRTSIIVRKNATCEIGNNVGISNSTFVCTTNITIEDDVLIGGDCRFFDTDFHSLDYVSRTNTYKNGIPDGNVKSSPISIKKGAWIGGGCIILKGVTIGAKSVIGAGSIVSKDIPDNELWAGNPIQFIRKLSV